jgi:hypothetical protein
MLKPVMVAGEIAALSLPVAYTLVTARPAFAQDITAPAVMFARSVASKVQSKWSPDCAHPNYSVRVTFALNGSGEINGDVRGDLLGTSGAGADEARRRATKAVLSAAPFVGVPAALVGKPIQATLDPAQACAR